MGPHRGDGALPRLSALEAEHMVRARESSLFARGRAEAWRPELVKAVRDALATLPETHPAASVALRRCENTSHLVQLGAVACGVCWEEAIRADQQVVDEFDLPFDQDDDPLGLDGSDQVESSQVA